MLNPVLIEKQGLTSEDVRALEVLHKMMDDVIKNPEMYDNPVLLIEELEYKMQRLWKFEEDRNMHTHWLRIKGCTCPYYDNMERRGTPYRIAVKDCPWHGWK